MVEEKEDGIIIIFYRSSPRNSPSTSPRPFSGFTARKTVPDIIIDSHDNEEELKKVRETLSALEATEDSVQEKMVNFRFY